MAIAASNPPPAQPDPSADPKPKKKVKFIDTWTGLGVFVLGIVLVRTYLFEPFKIPSGSMEPSLIGHQDYGDRIVTNKIPFNYLGTEPKRFETIVFDYDSAWEGQKPGKKKYIKRLVGLPGETIVISGGDLFLKDPATKRERILRKWEEGSPELQENLWLPVSVARFTEQALPAEKEGESADERLAREILQDENHAAFPWNVEAAAGAATRERGALRVQGAAALEYAHAVSNVYVKMGHWPFWHRGCPKAHLPPLVSPEGVPFKDPKETTETIRPYIASPWTGVRCPHCGRLAFPVERDRATEPRILPANAGPRLSLEVLEVLPGGLRVKVLNGTVIPGDRIASEDAPAGAVELSVERVFELRGEERSEAPELRAQQVGVLVGPLTANETIEEGKAATWHVTPKESTPFFYGGGDTAGDLKLEVELTVEQAGGALELRCGSHVRQAAWVLSLGGEAPKLDAAEGVYEVAERPTLAPGAHRLSLAYVDGSVLAELDGRALPPQTLDVKALGKAAKSLKSLARVVFHGAAQVKVTQLNLHRDLYYTLELDGGPRLTAHHNAMRKYDPQEGRYELQIPKYNAAEEASEANVDGFMMLGDNSPSSQDSRVWGFVPRENIVGQASLVWWPPTRWRIIR